MPHPNCNTSEMHSSAHNYFFVFSNWLSYDHFCLSNDAFQCNWTDADDLLGEVSEILKVLSRLECWT